MFFIPHETIPQHLVIHPSWIIQTSDMQEEYFRWSRLIHNNYIKDKGFLTNNPAKRIKLHGFKREHGTDWAEDYATEVDPEGIVNELLPILEPNKATIFHYAPEGYVRDIILNVDVNVLQQLPEQYGTYYYDNF